MPSVPPDANIIGAPWPCAESTAVIARTAKGRE